MIIINHLIQLLIRKKKNPNHLEEMNLKDLKLNNIQQQIETKIMIMTDMVHKNII